MATSQHAAVAWLPSTPGVYRFRDRHGRTLYIGRAVDLRRRVRSYWGRLDDRRHLTRMVARIATVEAIACDSEHEAAWLERNLLEVSLPYWNRTAGGQEVPVYIRLDGGARTTGITVVHSRPAGSDGGPASARYFGPYLGGAKVRLAVSGLDRVLPLAYAGDGLDGLARDLARVRGVATTDRGAITTLIRAVLDRQAQAVAVLHDELVRLRDRAAAELAFEFAARLQAELEAVDWVICVQRATAGDERDVDIHGWSDGVLVRFGVRRGRLCTWSQRPSTLAAARRRVDETPAEWRSFARRNAELAARLTAP
jgi:excinuclease ABC subunit C